ncbi:adherence factor [Chlamydia sp. 12-01]|uniref:adherence factor n=1 Tax=Chlamydia sp. 12-01 TaxID=3002742 RepID=UPI0035D4DB38
MSVNFFTPLCFSQQCLGEMAQAGKSILLEKLSGRLDSLFIQRSEGIEIKALGPNGELLCERVGKTDSITSLCLKVLLVLLIVPVIIALVLKIIVRLCLYLKYPGKVQEVAAPAPKPIVKPIVDPTIKPVVPPVTIEEVVEAKPKPLTREEIINTFVTLPSLSPEQQTLLMSATELINSGVCTSVGDYRDQGILLKHMPARYLPIPFELIDVPGIKCTYYPGYLLTDEQGNQYIITSVVRASERFRERLGVTANFLEDVPITTDSSKEQVEALIREGLNKDSRLGMLAISIFTVGKTVDSLGEQVGVVVEKRFD